MLKGIQKQMIMIKTSESPLFETAYLVMRNDVKSDEIEKADMLTEANKIVDGIIKAANGKKRDRKRHTSKKIFSFAAGILLGAVLVFVIYLVLNP